MATPVSTEARGRLRRWRAQQNERCDRLRRVLNTDATFETAHAFMARNSVIGRHRAFIKLQRSIAPYATFEGVRFAGAYPLAVWAVLHPREAVVLEDRADDPGLTQDCISVDFLCAGRLPGEDLASALWTFECPLHALGRLLQRAPPATDPGTVMLAAHHRVRRLRQSDIAGCFADRQASFLLPAGSGAFVCTLQGGHYEALGEKFAHIRARTWLDRDQLDEHQEKQVVPVDDDVPGARLGDSLFLPVPLRQLVEREGCLQVRPWGEGMPAM